MGEWVETQVDQLNTQNVYMQMKKILKYSLRILGWIVMTVLVVVILTGLLIQTRPVKKKIASVAGQKASGFINGQLSIGSIDGNFFTNLSLKNLSLIQNSDTIAFIAGIHADYNLWSLLSGKFLVHSVSIDHPEFYLRQINDSTWNVQQIIKPSSSSPKDTAASQGSFEAELTAFRITEGTVHIQSADTLIPEKINHLNTSLSLNWSTGSQKLQLTGFSFSAQKPDLELKQLKFEIERNQETIELAGFYLKTAKNQLEGSVEYHFKAGDRSSANLQSDSLHVGEFEFFLPKIKIPATPVLKLNAYMQQDSLYATVDLADRDQRIHLELASPNLAAFLYHDTDSLLSYSVTGNLEHIELAHWLGDPELKYLINGRLTAEGKGTDLNTATVSLDGEFKESRLADKPIDQLTFSFNLENGDLNGLAEGHGNFGEFRLKPNIRNLNNQPSYQAKLVLKKINLALLTGDDSLQSDINLQAMVTGKGFDPETLSARATVNLSKSNFKQVQIDTLLARIRYENENLQIDSLEAQTGDLALHAHGNYSLRSNSDLLLNARLEGMKTVTSFIPVDSLQGSGTIEGHLSGTPDSLKLLANVELEDPSYGNFSVKKLLVNANALLTKKDTTLNAHLLARELRNNSLKLDSVSADVEASTDSLFVSARLANRDLSSRVQSGINLGKKIKITLSEWFIDYKNEHWALQQAPAVIEMDSLNYRVNNFRLASGVSDTAQYIQAKGVVSRTGKEDFVLDIARVDMEQLAEMLNPGMNASGLFNLSMNLSGTANAPVLKGDFGLDKAMLNDYEFKELGGTVNYENKRLDLETKIVPRDSGRIEFTGNIPLQMHLDSISFGFNPKDSVNVLLAVERFPLAVLKAFNMNEEINGDLNGKVTVKGTVESPDPSGNLSLKNGAFKIDEYGVDYRNIGFNMKFLPDKISLDTFLIKTSDGQMTATGQVDFNSDFYKGDIKDSKIKIRFHQFNPIDHKQLNMQVSGDASIGGEKGNVVFNGDLKIPEAEINLPALFNMLGKMGSAEIPEPLLVAEMKKMKVRTDTLSSYGDKEKQEADTLSFNYFNSLTGDVKINIPKNTWIKNEDMHVEISGDLELIKHKEFLEIFGALNVVRGQYDLLGKTFVIDKGTINFQGGEEINPRLNVQASYGFRNAERIEQDLTVNITGTMESPAVSFNMAGDSINEGDALSYILFGKSMDELSMNQQSNIGGAGGGNLASNAAASMISSQLSGYLGNKLDVDYLEIKSNGDFNNATVVVGKYITNDLFVSYEQRLGETNKDDDMATYEVKLEYELFRFLFLQLNNSSTDSGFDLIFKFDTK